MLWAIDPHWYSLVRGWLIFPSSHFILQHLTIQMPPNWSQSLPLPSQRSWAGIGVAEGWALCSPGNTMPRPCCQFVPLCSLWGHLYTLDGATRHLDKHLLPTRTQSWNLKVQLPCTYSRWKWGWSSIRVALGAFVEVVTPRQEFLLLSGLLVFAIMVAERS